MIVQIYITSGISCWPKPNLLILGAWSPHKRDPSQWILDIHVIWPHKRVNLILVDIKFEMRSIFPRPLYHSITLMWLMIIYIVECLRKRLSLFSLQRVCLKTLRVYWSQSTQNFSRSVCVLFARSKLIASSVNQVFKQNRNRHYHYSISIHQQANNSTVSITNLVEA